MSQKILIVGGVAGGATAAARLRRLSEDTEIIIFEKGAHVSFANCGLPYYIGDVIESRDSLLVQTPEKLHTRYNLDVRVDSEVLSIDREKKVAKVKNHSSGEEYEETYDKLILSPGARATKPPIPGLDKAKNIFTLKNICDSDKLKDFICDTKPESAVIVGGGYTGIEMAESLHGLGIKVTVVELLSQVLSPLDFEMASIVHKHLREKGIELILNDGIKEFKDDGRTVILESGKEIQNDFAYLGIGAKPRIELAKEAGLKIGDLWAIEVNEHMQTSDPDIYAVGDAVQVTDFISGRPTRVPLAWPANRQGIVAANSVMGHDDEYPGSLGTGIVQLFDLQIASTGWSAKRLREEGREFHQVHIHQGSHAKYYPGASTISLKLLFAPDGEILGVQGVGKEGVDKRVDVIATAIKGGIPAPDLVNLELAYAPQFSSAKDPVNMLGYVVRDVLDGLVEVVHWDQIEDLREQGVEFLDVREEAELELGQIPGAISLPLTRLRSEYSELDKSKRYVVYCKAGMRGYVACRILAQNGYDVLNLSGGYLTYSAVNPPEEPESETKESEDEDDPGKGSAPLMNAPKTKVDDGQPKIDVTVDASGLQCPGPLQEVHKALKEMEPSQVMMAIATDPGFNTDIDKWAGRMGHAVLQKYEEDDRFVSIIRKDGNDHPYTEPHHEDKKKFTMIVFDNDFDKAMATFILANGAATFGKEVTLFFTFWGLNLLRKPNAGLVNKTLIEQMFGMMMPKGARKSGISKMNMLGIGPRMIKSIMKQKNVASIDSLISDAREAGVKFVACTMSMDVMGIKKEELIDGVEFGGVGSYIAEADQAGINLFV